MTGLRMLGPADEPQESGAIVAVHWGDYRQQQIFVRSGANVGNWYCLGGEFGRVKIEQDPRTYAQQLTSREYWRQPPGTIPLHPTWSDILNLGPVVLLTPAADGPYVAGWKAGRRALWEDMEMYVADGPPPGRGDAGPGGEETAS